MIRRLISTSFSVVSLDFDVEYIISTHLPITSFNILTFCTHPLPPPVDAHVGGPSEPGVQDVDAAQGVRPRDGVPQRGVVVQPQSLPEPVNSVDYHIAGLNQLIFIPGRVTKKSGDVPTKGALLCCFGSCMVEQFFSM